MLRRIEARIVNPLLGTRIPLPTYATDGAAAMDLRACLEEPLVLAPGQRALVKTGLAINMMDPGLVAIVASRSGLSLKHGIRVAQGIGVIDADYHGEIGVILANDGEQPFTIEPGERIAQLMFQPVVQVGLQFVDNFSTTTARGEGGFGSTGRL
ncbi:dUTP diphosphatase [Caldimonas thermodepolymerans]|jgi:deoxyuridine 5''-triphosphate nucleotidohydrolase (dut)|uniref:Deoxyuridine 5'-triphosphate nucleotidohydrolase n=1 Tax=Caldimonas thermodepolymerans TaxID=215580 RepID=A0A2S5T1N3_9BURK|nr:dUTP diphosphatase [Caldimonas thermodepolymerans]PPE68883.1 dUTP diphosphatase [Caldimonas thermodepolymerans]QPC30416.1 dUTP diphosphatase [Caldimonas thermodepolymerans]RDI03006.1 deoxyuridine 5'-triphosphate nucleotidohydrolase [Caldimonas thermodepolymerans]TCP08518.1 deoxyuridine 5'-triphosphate nucleotidohydrolase [Caldimonas thermodepolymerans]UZG46848.1 dUTP diphosphatase [Caldimonas thermodepolymerans]